MSWVNARRRLVFRHLLLSVTFVAAYLLLARPQVIFFFRPGFTAWYPASGLVLGLLLGVSPRYAILAAFCDWLTNILTYHQGRAAWIGILAPLGPALCYGIAAQVLRGPVRIDLRLQRRADLVRFALVSMAAALVSTSIGVSFLALDHIIHWQDFGASAAGWFWGDGVGVFGVAPFLLVYIFPWVRRWLGGVPDAGDATAASPVKKAANPRAFLEAAAQAVSLIAVLWIIFVSPWREEHLLFLAFIPIIWVAMRPGIRRVVIALLIMNFGIVGCMHLTEHAPLGIVVLDSRGHVEFTNQASQHLFCKTSEELLGARLGDLVSPEEGASAPEHWSDQILAGPALRRMVRCRGAAGGVVHLELNAVPLRIEGRVRGAYALFSDVSEQVREAKARREHADSLDRLVKQLEAQTAQITKLNEMAQLLQCCANSTEAYAVAARSLRLIFPKAAAGVLYTYRASRNLLETAAHWGGSAASQLSFAPTACWGLRLGQAHWSNPEDPTIACAHLEAELAHRSLCVPMIAQGETNGILHLEYAEDEALSCGADPMQWQSRERLAGASAAQIALSLASLALRDTLRDQSIRDALTGLYNRRFLQEGLDRELQRAQRSHRPVAVLFLDQDHFKKLNDTFGHQAGDFVLRCLAEEFLGFFRGLDLVCRFGGEEFAVVLPDSTAQQAASRADQLRAYINGLRLQYKHDLLDHVSVSIGVAAFPEHGSSSEDLIKQADRALYECKAAGRNCVRIASGMALLAR
jgi:diguanylate cyclase (GGDEF)-like protein/PAS domain S-box-containing protein